jgi:hypothetical protein
MSNSDVWYKHRIWCVTEAAYVTTITETEAALTTCPTNAAHTIDADSNHIVAQKSSTLVNVAQEHANSTTNGKYTCHSRTCLALACPTGAESTGRVTSDVYRMNIPFTVFTGIFQAREGMDRDKIDLRLVPKNEQAIGYITQGVTYGTTTLNVASPVLALAGTESSTVYVKNALTGFCSENVDVDSIDITGATITLKNGLELEGGTAIPSGATSLVYLLSNNFGTITTGQPVTTMNRWIYITTTSQVWQELLEGRWINIYRTPTEKSERRMIDRVDAPNGRVHISAPFDVAMDPADGTIYMQLTLKPLHNVVLKDHTSFVLGQSLIGGAYHPREVTIIADYTRKRTSDIEFDFMFEMFA